MLGLCVDTFPALASRTGELPTCAVATSSADPAVLTRIHQPEVNLAIWHRDLPPTLRSAALAPLMAAAPFTVIVVGAPEEIADRLAAALPSPVPADLLLDLADLAAVFMLLDRGRSRVRLRLEALVHDGCSRWHADAVGLRLLCTYRGAGTQWLPLLGGASAARSLNGETPALPVGQLPIGAIAVLKGERYPDNAGNGCIHRSPPAGPGQRARLLLCIDQTEWNLEE